MFVLIENEKHLKQYLIDKIISIEAERGLFQIRRGVSIQKHIKPQYMPRFPALICTYTANLGDGEEHEQRLMYKTCTRSIAKRLVYKTTNTLPGLTWRLCNNHGEYRVYQDNIAKINKIGNNNIIPPTDALYIDKSNALLITYVTYLEPYGRQIMRFFTLTLQEAKSLVYYEKDKKVTKAADGIGGIIDGILDSHEARQKVILKERNNITNELRTGGVIIARNKVVTITRRVSVEEGDIQL